MNIKTSQHYFLLALLFGAILLTFFILRPFLYVAILALVCVVVFAPLHRKIIHLLPRHQRLAALITTLLIVVVILLPLIGLGVMVFGEVQQFYTFFIKQDGKDALDHLLSITIDGLKAYIPQEQTVAVEIDQYINQALLWLLGNLAYVFGSATKLLFNFFLFFIITYYLFLDGDKFKMLVIQVSPLADDDDRMILEKVRLAINSVIRGSLVVALVQGCLVAIGFGLFGVPNIALWSMVATVASLVPGIGTAIVSMPAVMYLFSRGHVFLAFGLLAWSVLIVGLVDNLLRPILIGKAIKIHTLLIFLSVVGAIIFFGPIGFLLGPLLISLLFALVEAYASLRKRKAL